MGTRPEGEGVTRRPVDRPTGLAKPAAPASILLAVVLLIGEAFVVAGLLGSAVADSPDRVRLNPWALVALTLLVMAIAVQVLRGVRYAWSASVIALSLLFCAAALNGELSLLPWLALPLVLLITPSARAWMFADDAAAAPADAPPPAAGQ